MSIVINKGRAFSFCSTLDFCWRRFVPYEVMPTVPFVRKHYIIPSNIITFVFGVKEVREIFRRTPLGSCMAQQPQTLGWMLQMTSKWSCGLMRGLWSHIFSTLPVIAVRKYFSCTPITYASQLLSLFPSLCLSTTTGLWRARDQIGWVFRFGYICHYTWGPHGTPPEMPICQSKWFTNFSKAGCGKRSI